MLWYREFQLISCLQIQIMTLPPPCLTVGKLRLVFSKYGLSKHLHFGLIYVKDANVPEVSFFIQMELYMAGNRSHAAIVFSSCLPTSQICSGHLWDDWQPP
ncbi:hypothetical protein GOODEAATRI_005830 [Goodea atripinnis]|uniref:Uncharacterized protein n=1 Tax=Goodea atripinnis TaxID=208336 RepID=A0ABV0PL70_9TELE